MRTIFPNRETLEAMPISVLRQIDIKEKDEEEIVQEILSKKLSQSPAAVKEINFIIPDIKTKAEEDYWQKKIDEARGKQREDIALQGKMPEAQIVETPVIPDEAIPSEVKTEEKPIESVVKPKRRYTKKAK